MSSPTATCAPCNPVMLKKSVPYEPLDGGLIFSECGYSAKICNIRNVAPSVHESIKPKRKRNCDPFWIPRSAQCAGTLDDHKIPDMINGRPSGGFSMPCGGHTGPARQRKYQYDAISNAKSVASVAISSAMPHQLSERAPDATWGRSSPGLPVSTRSITSPGSVRAAISTRRLI